MKFTQVKVLVIGSGAAGLNAALQISYRGIDDILILTEGLDQGTSINTGSDKQTYYKLSLSSESADSPGEMAKSYFDGGSMHGDLALVESALSVQAFTHLVQLGVPFPTDAYGQFIGYKTDHDPRQRATSIGPYTSKKMCECLIDAVRSRKIRVREHCEVISLLVESDGSQQICYGAIVLNETDDFEIVLADYVIFAVGGPGGLYRDSVYPVIHSGAIGLALLAGAKARNLQESQFGLASTKFRWNVSGTFMQVIPRVISTADDGESDRREFLLDGFLSAGECYSKLFLKGYQWPFDARKIPDGSSLIDLLVYHEQVVNQRRVFLDFRQNPSDFQFEGLSPEAFQYLEKSNALLDTPIERLEKMNPGAIDLYQRNGIDLRQEPLEISVCAQHNNGGLAGTLWWESENIQNLFPIGEVNGSHGVARPGGSALNAGQVGGFRTAELIAYRERKGKTASSAHWNNRRAAALAEVNELSGWVLKGKNSGRCIEKTLAEIQKRMSESGGFYREASLLSKAEGEAGQLVDGVFTQGMKSTGNTPLKAMFRVRQLCFSHWVYLSAIRASVDEGGGSRGSALVCDPSGDLIHMMFPDHWRKKPEDVNYQELVLETLFRQDHLEHQWVQRRPLPNPNTWFETGWAAFRKDEIFGEDGL